MSFHKPSPLFRRYENNPILTPKDWPYPANAVFNPGATELDGETLLLVRVEDMEGFSHLTLARSADGKTGWQIHQEPTLVPDTSAQERNFGIEDPSVILRRSDEWIFGPSESYELVGDAPQVTFPTGAIHDNKTGELRVYYGAADTTVALAIARMKDVLNYILSCPEP